MWEYDEGSLDESSETGGGTWRILNFGIDVLRKAAKTEKS
jgi:hypothetical protein